MNNRNLIKSGVKIIFFVNQESQIRNLFIKTIMLSFVLFGIEIFFNYWHAWSYKIFLNKNIPQIIVYFLIFSVLSIIQTFVHSQLIRRKNAFTVYSRERFYETFKNKTNLVELTCQRLSEDLTQFFDLFLKLFLELILTILKIPVYFFILFRITTFYSAFIAVLYAIIGNILIRRISQKLIDLDYAKENANGHFRKELILAIEEKKCLPSIANIRNASLQFTNQESKLVAFQGIFNHIRSLIKYAIFLPMYLQDIITFANMSQSLDAFKKLTDSCGYIIENKKDISVFLATITRIQEL